MEVGVLASLLGGLVLVGLRAGPRPTRASLVGLPLLASACVLTRPDMLPSAAMVGFFVVWRCAPAYRWVAGLLIVAGLLLPVVAQHTFRWIYYGELLPNTYYLKLTGVSLSQRLTRGAVVLAKLMLHHLFPLLVFALPALLRMDRFPPRVRPSASMRLLAGLVLVQCAYSVYVGGDAWEHLGFVNRYIGVAMPELFVLVAVGIVHTLENGKEAWWRISWSVVGGLCCLRGAYLLLTAYTHAESDVLLAAPWVRLSEGAALVAIGTMVLVGHRRARRASELFLRDGRGASASGAMALLLAFLVNFRPVGHWLIEDASEELEGLTRLGVHLRNTTDEQTRIAVVRAGAIPYFSHRHSIDLLGKCDKVIARSGSVEASFRPGHNKYDLRHSIGGLRPDVIAEVRQHPRFRTEEVLRSYGYRQLSNGIYVNDAVPRRLDDELGRPWL